MKVYYNNGGGQRYRRTKIKSYRNTRGMDINLTTDLQQNESIEATLWVSVTVEWGVNMTTVIIDAYRHSFGCHYYSRITAEVSLAQSCSICLRASLPFDKRADRTEWIHFFSSTASLLL